MAVRNKLKDIRHLHKMNQTEFAAILGIGVHHYNRYERQKTQPETETLLKMAKKLNITVEQIVYLVDEAGE